MMEIKPTETFATNATMRRKTGERANPGSGDGHGDTMAGRKTKSSRDPEGPGDGVKRVKEWSG